MNLRNIRPALPVLVLASTLAGCFGAEATVLVMDRGDASIGEAVVESWHWTIRPGLKDLDIALILLAVPPEEVVRTEALSVRLMVDDRLLGEEGAGGEGTYASGHRLFPGDPMQPPPEGTAGEWTLTFRVVKALSNLAYEIKVEAVY